MQAFTCPKCRVERIITDPESGEVVCSSCGLVIEDKIEGRDKLLDNGLSGRFPASSYDMGQSTIIGDSNKDAKGQKIQSLVLSDMQRLRTWNYRIQQHDSKERNLKKAFSLLYAIKGKFNLTDAAIERASHIYRKAVIKKLVSGRSIDAVLVASIFIAVREMSSSLSLRDVSAASNIRIKTVARVVRMLASELGISIPADDPNRSINKVGSAIGLSEKTKREAMDLMSAIKEKEYCAGKNPTCLAATIVYVACGRTGECASQKEIAKAAGVTEVTVRARVRDLKAKNLI